MSTPLVATTETTTALRQALAASPRALSLCQLWQVPGRTRAECVARYKSIAAALKEKKAKREGGGGEAAAGGGGTAVPADVQLNLMALTPP